MLSDARAAKWGFGEGGSDRIAYLGTGPDQNTTDGREENADNEE